MALDDDESEAESEAEAEVEEGGPGVAGAAGGREERRRGAAVQMTVKMVVDVPVLFNDTFPQSSPEGGTFQLRRRDLCP